MSLLLIPRRALLINLNTSDTSRLVEEEEKPFFLPGGRVVLFAQGIMMMPVPFWRSAVLLLLLRMGAFFAFPAAGRNSLDGFSPREFTFPS